MNRPDVPGGLYVITDSSLIPAAELVARVGQAIAGGAVMVQYREKHLPLEARRRAAEALARLCRQHDIPLIINDDVELARAVGAHGVHLGREDASISHARSLLGQQAIIGVSCYNRLERALEAARRGASYLAFGRFFPSATKPEALPAHPDLLRQARSQTDLPIAAIGGITPQNGDELIKAGADLLAVIHGVFGQPDVQAAARAYAALFQT